MTGSSGGTPGVADDQSGSPRGRNVGLGAAEPADAGPHSGFNGRLREEAEQPTSSVIHKPKHRQYRSHSQEDGGGAGRSAGRDGEQPATAGSAEEHPAKAAARSPTRRRRRSRSRSASRSRRHCSSRSPGRARSASRGRKPPAHRRRGSRSGSGVRRSRSRSRGGGRRMRSRSGEPRRHHAARSRSPRRQERRHSRSHSRSRDRDRYRRRSRSPRRTSRPSSSKSPRRREAAEEGRRRHRSRSRSRSAKRRGHSESPPGRGGRKRGRSSTSPRQRQKQGERSPGKPAAAPTPAAMQPSSPGPSVAVGLSPLPASPSAPSAPAVQHATLGGAVEAEAQHGAPLAGGSPPSSQGRPSMVVRLRIRPSLSSGSKEGTPAGASPQTASTQLLSPRERAASPGAAAVHAKQARDHGGEPATGQQASAALPRAPSDTQHTLSPRAAAQHAKPKAAAQRQQPGSARGTPCSGAALRERLSFGDEIEEEGEQEGAQVGGAKEGPRVGRLAVATARRFMRERELVVLHPLLAPAAHAALMDEDSMPLPAGEAPAGGKTLGPVHFGAAMAKGMRPYMEDRHTLVASLLPLSSTGMPIQDGVARCFAGVYDGHNGALAAEHAADRLHHLLAAEPALRTCTGDGPPSTLPHEAERMGAALRHAFEATDREILVRCRLEGNKSGATGVAVVCIGEVLYAAHAGDSRAVLCRGGAPLRLTEDHKPNLPRERQRVEGAGGRVDFARCWRVIVEPGGGRPASGLAVSRSFGDPDFKEPRHLVTATPDIAQHRLRPGDTFVVLASDGLWDVLTDEEACDAVRGQLGRTPAGAGGVGGSKESRRPGGAPLDTRLATSAAEALVQLALVKGTMDNVTAVVALLQWD